MTQPLPDRDRPSVATGSRPTRPRSRAWWIQDGDLRRGNVYGQRLFKRSDNLPSNAVGTPCSAWHPAQDAMRSGEAGCESQPQRSHESIGRLGIHLGQAPMH